MSTPQTHTGVGLTEKGGKLSIIQLSTPIPKENEILIKTLYVAPNPLSQWQVDFGLLVFEFPHILGTAVVGKVDQIGDGVNRVKKGDLVMGFAWERREQKASQEYVILLDHLFCKVPSNITPQQAAAVPDSFVTAWHSLITGLEVPLMDVLLPQTGESAYKGPQDPETTFLIWGGATSSGMYAIQLLRLCGYKNILTTASQKHADRLVAYGALHVFDYRDPSVVNQIKKHTSKVDVLLDCVGDEGRSVKPISQIASDGSRVGILLPIRSGGYGNTTEVCLEIKVEFAKSVKMVGIRTIDYLENPINRAKLQPVIMHDLIANGSIDPNPIHEVEGSSFLERSAKALELMREGKVSGQKLVVRVRDDDTT